jgi:hypothetical protein
MRTVSSRCTESSGHGRGAEKEQRGMNPRRCLYLPGLNFGLYCFLYTFSNHSGNLGSSVLNVGITEESFLVIMTPFLDIPNGMMELFAITRA